MECKDVVPLLHLYADNELDALTTMELDRHFSQCRQCAARRSALESLRGALQIEGVYQRPSSSLRRRVEFALDEAAGVRNPWRMPPRWLSLAAAVLLIAGAAAAVLLQPSRATQAVARDIVASHVRSTLAEHLMDVASTDQHTVKPWFQGRLDYSVEVNDLADEGFPLKGGRLDYVNGRTVAALVYFRAKHPINLFIWPQADARFASEQHIELQGYHLIGWTENGMCYWAVSNLNKEELQRFVKGVQHEK